MAYRIEGLAPERFASLFGMADDALAEHNAVRVTADTPSHFPCRISLEDAAPGEQVILLNHVSHDVAGPFRTAFAIYVREGVEAASFTDRAPPMLDGRTIGLRGFDGEGMLRGALLAMPGEADAKIRALLAQPEIATIHAHNAAHGCFLARIERN